MSTRCATYKRLRAHLILQGRTVTEYAAALGTSGTQIEHALANQELHRVPSHPLTYTILEAVARELGDDTILPAEPVHTAEKESV